MRDRQIHPDQPFNVGHFGVSLEYLPGGASLNFLLSKTPLAKRARIISMADRPITTGVWTPEEAAEVVARLQVGRDTGNFFDPQERSGFLRPFQYLGLIR